MLLQNRFQGPILPLPICAQIKSRPRNIAAKWAYSLIFYCRRNLSPSSTIAWIFLNFLLCNGTLSAFHRISISPFFFFWGGGGGVGGTLLYLPQKEHYSTFSTVKSLQINTKPKENIYKANVSFQHVSVHILKSTHTHTYTYLYIYIYIYIMCVLHNKLGQKALNSNS